MCTTYCAPKKGVETDFADIHAATWFNTTENRIGLTLDPGTFRFISLAIYVPLSGIFVSLAASTMLTVPESGIGPIPIVVQSDPSSPATCNAPYGGYSGGTIYFSGRTHMILDRNNDVTIQNTAGEFNARACGLSNVSSSSNSSGYAQNSNALSFANLAYSKSAIFGFGSRLTDKSGTTMDVGVVAI